MVVDSATSISIQAPTTESISLYDVMFQMQEMSNEFKSVKRELQSLKDSIHVMFNIHDEFVKVVATVKEENKKRDKKIE